MKTDVHRDIHEEARQKKMVTIEGINVCLGAWMLIARVAESTFYRYLKYMKANQEARDHSNTGLLKPREHTQQATASYIIFIILEVSQGNRSSRGNQEP